MPKLITRIKKCSISMILVPFLVVFYPAATFAAASDPTNNGAQTTTDTSQPAATTGPQSPTGADASTYHLNPETGNWENDHYIWNPTTQQTTPKDAPTTTQDPTTGQWSTDQWQYDASSGQYVPVPVATSMTTTSTDSSLSTTTNSVAQSGDATVSNNTQSGDAATGNAMDMANIINLLQSSLSTSGNDGGVVTFLANIPGNVVGNLLIDPSSVVQNQSTSSPLQSGQAIQVNNQNDGQINNQVVLNATSGNASVVGNTAAGSATSGNAGAVANIINLMNSSVNAGQSFVGVVNIQGDLSGDILLPAGFINSLIASNAAANTLSNTNNQNITNTAHTTANSGNASVVGNTAAGSATTGGASTNLTVMNLTGSDIIGSNALMVFVNVLGSWTGLIINAPQGATTATLGGNIDPTSTIDGSSSTNTSSALTNNNNASITNDVSVNAQSGDATVSHNSSGGNATTGNASAVVNLANIVSSHLSLSNWFGILFINVLGSWEGNFGASLLATVTNAAPTTGSQNNAQVFGFSTQSASNTSRGITDGTTTSNGDASSTVPSTGDSTRVLGATTHAASQQSPKNDSNTFQQPINHSTLLIPIAGVALGILVLGSDRLITLVRRN